jgi:ribonuclease Z
VPTRGYGVFQRRTKLKSEFTGLTKAEIQARKTQEELFQQISVPQLVYLCDTSEKVFEQAELFEFPVIIVECTFWHHDDYQRAKITKHIHWEDLEPIIRAHPGTQFILIHFSERYNMHKLKAEIVWPENCLLWHESNPLLSVA